MTSIEKLVRPARIEDADVLAELVDYAGEGLPSYLWDKIAGPRETAQEVGRKRAARETGSFSYRNATMIEHAERAAGTLMGCVGSGRSRAHPVLPWMGIERSFDA